MGKENWENSCFGEVAEYINGRAFKPGEWEVDGKPIIRIQNLNNPSAAYNYSSGDFNPKFLVESGDLLMAWSASLGAYIWKGKNAWLNQHIFRVICDEKKITKNFLYYGLKYSIPYLYKESHGSGMVHITKKKFTSFPIPVPPLEEQQRIVDKIEVLFSEVDAGVAALKQAQSDLQRYRQSVLKHTFEGKLSEKWREEVRSGARKLSPEDQMAFEGGGDALLKAIKAERTRKAAADLADWKQAVKAWEAEGKPGRKPRKPRAPKELPALSEGELNELPAVPEEWVWVRVLDVGKVQLGRQRAPKHHHGTHMRPYLRVANVFENRIDLTDVKEMNFSPEEFEQYKLEYGDILLNEGQSLELVGRPAMFRNELTGACFQNTLVRFKSEVGLSKKFMLYLFLHYFHNGNFSAIASWTTSIAHLGAQRFAELGIPLPSLPEQIFIVEEIERRLSAADHMMAEIEKGLAEAEALRQSILKKAFAGELV